MARMHGKECRLYLGARDASGDLISVSPKLQADAIDATTFGSAGWRQADPGLLGFTVAVDGWYDPAAGGVARQFETLLGATGGIISLYEGSADLVGDKGILFSDAILRSRDQPIAVGDLIKLSGEFQGSGRVGYNGRILHILAEDTVGVSGASLNNLGSSANGGRGTLHVTAVTGSWTIVIEHSSDNGELDPWAALVTFSQVTAGGGATAETKEVTGTVKQYLRVTSTEDVAGSVTFVCGFARY